MSQRKKAELLDSGKFLDSESILRAEIAQSMGERPNQQVSKRKTNWNFRPYSAAFQPCRWHSLQTTTSLHWLYVISDQKRSLKLNNSYSKGVIEVEVSIQKIAFHNLTRELSRINSLQSSYFDECGKVFWPLETGNISSYFILWPFDLYMEPTKH